MKKGGIILVHNTDYLGTANGCTLKYLNVAVKKTNTAEAALDGGKLLVCLQLTVLKARHTSLCV